MVQCCMHATKVARPRRLRGTFTRLELVVVARPLQGYIVCTVVLLRFIVELLYAILMLIIF